MVLLEGSVESVERDGSWAVGTVQLFQKGRRERSVDLIWRKEY